MENTDTYENTVTYQIVLKPNDKIVECLKNIETHALALKQIDSTEFMGNGIVANALLEIKQCLEEIDRDLRRVRIH